MDAHHRQLHRPERYPIFVEVYFIDRGESGDRDSARIYFTYDPDFAHDADSDPNVRLMTCNSGVGVTLGCYA